MGTLTVGVDIGQKRDPTAIAVVEAELRAVERQVEAFFTVRRLERLPLGTPYPEVATRLAEMVAKARQRQAQELRTTRDRAAAAAGEATLVTNVPGAGVGVPGIVTYVDATGVGQPIVDALRVAGTVVRAVYFTHGDRRAVDDRGEVTLGKAWLVSRLKLLMQNGRILLPKTDEAVALAQELQDYEIKVDANANDTYGAFKVGAHDDLVTALGLAVQVEPRSGGAPAVAGQRIGPTFDRHGNVIPSPDSRDWR